MAGLSVRDYNKRHQETERWKAERAESLREAKEQAERFHNCFLSNDFLTLYQTLEEIVKQVALCAVKLRYGDCENQFGIKMAYAENFKAENVVDKNLLKPLPRLYLGPSELSGKVAVRYQCLPGSRRFFSSKLITRKKIIRFEKLTEKRLKKLLKPVCFDQINAKPYSMPNIDWVDQLKEEFKKKTRERIQQRQIDLKNINYRRNNFISHDFHSCYRKILQKVLHLNQEDANLDCGMKVLNNHVHICFVLPKLQLTEYGRGNPDIRPQLRIFPAVQSGKIEVQRLGLFNNLSDENDLTGGKIKTYNLDHFDDKSIDQNLSWLLKSRYRL